MKDLYYCNRSEENDYQEKFSICPSKEYVNNLLIRCGKELGIDFDPEEEAKEKTAKFRRYKTSNKTWRFRHKLSEREKHQIEAARKIRNEVNEIKKCKLFHP